MSLLPYSDTNDRNRITPAVTYGLIALNVFFFLVELGQGSAPAIAPDAPRLGTLESRFRRMYAAPAATQAAPSDDGSPSAPQKPRLSDGVTKLRSIVPTQPWRYPLGLSVCCR